MSKVRRITVKELSKILKQFPEDAEVEAYYSLFVIDKAKSTEIQLWRK